MKPRTARAVSRLSELGHSLPAGRERHPERPRTEYDVPSDTLAALSSEVGRLTEIVGRFTSNLVNHILYTGTKTIGAGAENYWTRSFRTPFARVIVLPLTNDIRVENESPRALGGAAPTALDVDGGWYVPVTAGRVEIPMTGNVITVYGTAGAKFNIALLAKPIA